MQKQPPTAWPHYASQIFFIMYFIKNKEDRRKVTFPLVDYAEIKGAN